MEQMVSIWKMLKEMRWWRTNQDQNVFWQKKLPWTVNQLKKMQSKGMSYKKYVPGCPDLTDNVLIVYLLRHVLFHPDY